MLHPVFIRILGRAVVGVYLFGGTHRPSFLPMRISRSRFSSRPREIKGIVDAVRRSDITMPELRRHVARILFYKYMLRNRREAPDSLYIPLTDSIARKLRG